MHSLRFLTEKRTKRAVGKQTVLSKKTVDFAHLKRYIGKQQRQPLHGGKERTMDRKNQTFSFYMITGMARFYFAGYYFGVQKSEQCGC